MKNHSPHTGAHPQISASFHFCSSHPWWSCGTQKEGRRADAQWHCHKLTVLIASSAATSPHSFITAHLSALVVVSLLLSPFTLGEPREPAASLVQAQELRGRAKILPFHLLIPAGRLCSDHSPGHATPLLVLVPLSNRTPPTARRRKHGTLDAEGMLCQVHVSFPHRSYSAAVIFPPGTGWGGTILHKTAYWAQELRPILDVVGPNLTKEDTCSEGSRVFSYQREKERKGHKTCPTKVP